MKLTIGLLHKNGQVKIVKKIKKEIEAVKELNAEVAELKAQINSTIRNDIP